MRYISTRDKNRSRKSYEAIIKGLAEDGGLYTPESLPVLSEAEFIDLSRMSYIQRSAYILDRLLDDFSHEELLNYAGAAYGNGKFDNDAPAPLYAFDGSTRFLELWHGPTCAFKDMALQMLPHLLTASLKKASDPKTACILVATSGDTGSAALNGFRNVEGTKILVFYPKEGISEVQELQMTTMVGSNVGACGVYGNFDDAQTGVKAIFSNNELAEKLLEKDSFLSSANSINWGRVAPQIVYYISAYCDLINDGSIKFGDKINICVPTGNFGNILSAYYAGQMGMPLGRLLCASNSNNVLTDFINTGKYQSRRKFHTTISPSMDILISSNLERLLFHLSDFDSEIIKGYMKNLSESSEYEVGPELKRRMSEMFYAGCCDDVRTKEAISELFNNNGYLLDPHTAVAYEVLRRYREETGDRTLTVIASTASPFKFAQSVLDALGDNDIPAGVAQLGRLEEKTGLRAPGPLAKLEDARVVHTGVTDKTGMTEIVNNM